MRILIVEDEAVVARRVETMCRRILGEQLERIAWSETFDRAALELTNAPIDLLLLDLNLAGEDGMQLVRTSAACAFNTIIISANTDQALRAFEYGVIDFVPKPFTQERLAQALARVADQGGRATTPAKFLAIRKQGRIETVAVASIAYVQGAHNYSELVLHDGRVLLHDKSLDKLVRVLPSNFERIHKSYLVRVDDIAAIHAYEGTRYEAELKSGQRLPVGRTRYRELIGKLG